LRFVLDVGRRDTAPEQLGGLVVNPLMASSSVVPSRT
jgi:hypothetical protein